MARGRRRGPSLMIPMIIAIIAGLGAVYWVTTIWEEVDLAYAGYQDAVQERRSLEGARDSIAPRVAYWSDAIGVGNGGSVEPFGMSMTLRGLRGSGLTYNTVADPSQVPTGRTQAQRWGDIQQRNISNPIGANMVSSIESLDEAIDQVQAANIALFNALLRTAETGFDGTRASRSAIEAALADREELITKAYERGLTTADGVNSDSEFDAILDLFTRFDRIRFDSAADSNSEWDAMRRALQAFYTGQQGERSGAATRRQLREELDLLQRVRVRYNEALRALPRQVDESAAEISGIFTYDGTIIEVSQDWAYINLGQADNLKPGVTFRVLRFSGSADPIEVGQIEVESIQGPHYARCVIAQQPGDRELREGDKIISSTFARGSVERFVLIGEFGGQNSRFDKALTRRMLEDAGYVVDSTITRHTDVIVAGANYRNDPEYQRIAPGGELEAFRGVFQFWRPREVYYLLDHDE